MSSTSSMDFCGNGMDPRVTNSMRRTPNDQTSDLLLNRFSLIASGAVHFTGTKEDCDGGLLACIVKLKSAIFTLLPSATCIFLAARSRWMYDLGLQISHAAGNLFSHVSKHW